LEQKPQKHPPLDQPFDTIEGTLERFTFRNEDSGFAVVRFAPDDGSASLAAVGQLAQLAEGQKLRITGQRVEHPRFGPQIEVEGVEAVLPSSVEGIRTYLASSLVKGIGPSIAERITDRFGEDTLRVIEEQPELLEQVPGLGETKIADLCAAVQSQKDVTEVMVFLRAHGLGQALATRIVKHYRKGAIALIQANPFRLAEDVIGIGFKTADRLAGELGMEPSAPARIQAGTLHCLTQAARDGHCYLPREKLLEANGALLSISVELIDEQIPELVTQGKIRTQLAEDDSVRIYPTALHIAELGVAVRVDELRRLEQGRLGIDVENAVSLFEVDTSMQMPTAQRDAVKNALTHPLSVITGGPGVGKTTTVRAIAEVTKRHERTLLLCAPTGRAAKRLEESTGHSASTIHRLLDWQVGTRQFGHDTHNPLEGHVLVVDEVSMLDVQLAYNLFRAIPDSMHVVLVGDINQLPSVGPGQILRDIIESNVVPVTRLSEIFRQHGESLIIRNAHALLHGEMPTTGGEDSDFYVIEARDNQHTRELIQELVARRIPRRFGLDPLADVQVLCPMYRGHAGADTINADLQDLLNPGDQQIQRGGKAFREGDKVMQIRNDYDLALFNGDTGRITELDRAASKMFIRFGSRVVEYPFADLDALVPGYAITVHRAQGSEYPAVVIPLATDHYMMLRRNLLYTAITRARQLVVLVGSTKALEMAVRNNDEAHRYSGLSDCLRADA
jgi:exodeoxyribonuclease V alpha subunit